MPRFASQEPQPITPKLTRGLISEIVRAIPLEEIDAETAKNIIENPKGLHSFLRRLKREPPPPEQFQVKISGDLTVDQLIFRGRYTLVMQGLTSERFPLTQHSPRAINVQLIRHDYDIITEQVLFDFERRDLRRPTMEESLYIAAQHRRNRQEKLLFMCEGLQAFLVLQIEEHPSGSPLRYFDAAAWGETWHFGSGYYFVGIPK